ncbi:hypothetical protein RHMOL_Rhmol10G0120400 [Rhododendron molle]|uniref:Uncharacterized protein n=1 Tax=Rhododendron molle TaxID=49168 RepID=A0ACC0M2W0_RHOML|nr:hypothetical protein RHMOL_Rhmol10G0120400 [Rhododendron molle]
MDACMTCYLFALDLSEPNNEVKTVNVVGGGGGSSSSVDDDSDNDDLEWIPLNVGGARLVSLGRGKLGVVWALAVKIAPQIHVFWFILEMREKTIAGETHYEAYGLSRTDYYV